MGVRTPISLEEAQALFPSYQLKNLQETTDGVMDTTYLLDDYILKHYERDIDEKLLRDSKILELLKTKGLNTPLHLASAKGWHLYSRLEGEVPRSISYYHIQALARFLSKMHSITRHYHGGKEFLSEYNLINILEYCKEEHYFYYKKLQSIESLILRNDGFIHGDIFKDNTLFHGEKIGVFDFIDGGVGAFCFDVAVALVAFNAHKRKSYMKLFCKTYNQHAPRKIQLQSIEKHIKNAAKLYGLLRIEKYKNPKKAKELANLW